MTKSRRGWGEDSVYQDGDRWRGAISLGRTADGRRSRIKVSGSTKAEVIGKLKEVRRALDAGAESPTSRLNVGAYLDRWIDGVPGRVESSTAADYADTVRLHLKPGLGSKVLTRLTVSEVNALWANKRKAGYSANSIRIMRTVLRSALHQANGKDCSFVTSPRFPTLPASASRRDGHYQSPRRDDSSTPLARTDWRRSMQSR